MATRYSARPYTRPVAPFESSQIYTPSSLTWPITTRLRVCESGTCCVADYELDALLNARRVYGVSCR